AEYIIVNNDSGESSVVERLKSHPAAPTIIHESSNGGFGRANNSGAKAASGEVLFFVNPDAELNKGNLHSVLAAFRFRPKALYGMALARETGEREPWSSGSFPNLFRLIASHIAPRSVSAPWKTSQIQRVDWVSGAALAVRREFFCQIQGFDESFFLYFEDVDLARRATEVGGWVGVYPFMEFCHKGGQSHAGFREKKEAYYAGQRRYFRKWRPALESAALSIGHRIKDLFRSL
ncbi:MAG: glycosyltransferase, partial [Candidatus Moraniibacteriota bacterium]